MDPIIVECPHCHLCVEIVEINCAIFRHGIFMETGEQIDPHLPKELCDKYVAENRIYGCGKPFRICKNTNTIKIKNKLNTTDNTDTNPYVAIICDYI